ncbi:MAG: transketolase family protein [Lachnospiraceae bacterium]|nr:transketolase family protein [Lachnospiraceae bacterium]
MTKIIYNGENAGAFKDTLGKTIPAILEADKDAIYLDADLMNCIGTYGYAKEHPDRAINCGIAEANMAGIAAGLSMAGFKPIMHTFGPFASRRCFDQIYLSGGYAGNSVTVIGTDPGVTAAFNGGTHMPFEDTAVYRLIPDAYVMDATDPVLLADVLKQCVDMPGIKYIRVPRKNNKKMYEEGSTFEIGKGVVTKEDGSDCAVIAAGIMVGMAMAAAETLAKEGIQVTVIDMFTVKPLDEELVLTNAKQCGCVTVCENHNKIGGLVGAVSELLSQKMPTPLEYVAIEDEFGEVGPQDYLEERFELKAEHIAAKAKEVLERK